MHEQQQVRAVLAAGLAWLYTTVQPEGAIETHHGPKHSAGTRLALSFAPLPDPVIVVDVQDPQYENDGYRTMTNPLTEDECAAVAALLEELGHPPIDRWNGPGCDTGSFRLAGPIHPTLGAARQRYRQGCPDHSGPLCSWDGCPWFGTGHDLLVKPTWPDRGPASAEVARA